MDKILQDIVTKSHESFARGKMQAMHEASKSLPLVIQSDGTVGASGGGNTSNHIEYVVDTDNSTTDFSITVSTETVITITWGDGETIEMTAEAGSTTFDHTYSVTGTGIQYTVRIYFDNPQNVTQINFFNAYYI